MISGVSSYSSYSYNSTLASTQRSNSVSSGGGDAGGPAKIQEKLFSILDGNGDGSVAKDELNSALAAAKESDTSLTIDIDELFSQLDANGDGSLDSKETAAMAPPPPPGGPGSQNPEEMFAQLDTNSDGSIELDELTALAGQANSDISSLFSALDADGDGGLNIDEMATLAPPPPPPQNRSNSEELFNQLDTDSSSSVSMDELSSLLDSVAQSPSRRTNQEENDSGLIAKLLKQYQSNAGYQTSIGSRLNLSA
jgi:Ca2+-binding EF-hand superfamily protein